jgi:hypothetical protein
MFSWRRALSIFTSLNVVLRTISSSNMTTLGETERGQRTRIGDLLSKQEHCIPL